MTPLEKAIALLLDAEKQVRGKNRAAIKEALSVLQAPTKISPTQQDYELKKLGQMADPNRKGFILNCLKSGKTWQYRYIPKNTKTPKTLILGVFPALDVIQARKLWSLAYDAHKTGENPQIAIQKNRGITIRQLVDNYLEHISAYKKSWRQDETILRRNILAESRKNGATTFSPITGRVDHGDTPALALTDRIADLMVDDSKKAALASVKSSDGNTSAWRFASIAHAMIEIATGRTVKNGRKNWLPRDYRNPYVLYAHKPQKKPVTFTHKKAVQYHKVLSTSQNIKPIHRAVLSIQLLTCCRLREVADMQLNELDLIKNEWTIPAARMKNGQAHSVPLTKPILTLLEPYLKTDHEYLFAHNHKSKAGPDTGSLAKTIKLLIEANPTLGSFTSHHIRHACLSWLREQGCPLDIRDAISSHHNLQGVDALYSEGADLMPQARVWLQKWNEYLS